MRRDCKQAGREGGLVRHVGQVRSAAPRHDRRRQKEVGGGMGAGREWAGLTAASRRTPSAPTRTCHTKRREHAPAASLAAPAHHPHANTRQALVNRRAAHLR